MKNIRNTQYAILNTKALVFILLCFILPQLALAASPVARDIQARVIKDTQNSTLNLVRLQASDADVGDILSYALLSLPLHGQLKDEATGQEIITAPYLLSSSKLKIIPEPGFIGQDSFTYRANDGVSDSNIATVSLNIVEWFVPIGIPEPSFGIKETYRMYDDPSKRNSALTYTQNAEGGYYTHYVDNTHPAATDTSNPYGAADRPRRTIPRDLVTGSVVEIHGGPYTYVNGGDKILMNGIGTADMPIFIRGSVNIPEFTRPLNLYGEYIIFENFYFYNSGIGVRRPSSSEHFHHISIRNCETEGDGTTGGTGGIGAGSNTGQIVIYNNHLHHAGDYAYVGENDRMGTTAGYNSHYIWIVDNHIHHNGGDSFQAGHGAEQSTSHIYIGRNIMHDDGENAIDLKDCTDIIVSENTMYNYPGPDGIGSVGTITVTHYGPSATYVGTLRAWFLFNEMHTAKQSANQVSSGPQDIYFIGNVIHDIQGAALLGWQHHDVYFVGNTMYNVDTGISDSGSADAKAIIANNIFGKFNSPGGTHISLSYSAYNSNSIVSNNLFQDPMNVNTVSADSIEADPQFINAANNNFNLQSTSPAIDAGISSGAVQEALDRFEQLYGVNIRKDIAGSPRPQGSVWDIGAYEYTPSSGDIIYGDVSGDVEVSAYDAALTAQAAVGLITLTSEQTQKADVSGDAEISAYDAALIAQYSVGIINRFPVEG